MIENNQFTRPLLLKVLFHEDSSLDKQGTIESAPLIIPWESVCFESEDWDTAFKINMLNEQDADYNNITMEKVAALV